MSETAKEQYERFKELGREGVPFYEIPYLSLVEWKGQEKADEILAYYQKDYFLKANCVSSGVLLLSWAKHQKEKDEKEDRK